MSQNVSLGVPSCGRSAAVPKCTFVGRPYVFRWLFPLAVVTVAVLLTGRTFSSSVLFAIFGGMFLVFVLNIAAGVLLPGFGVLNRQRITFDFERQQLVLEGIEIVKPIWSGWLRWTRRAEVSLGEVQAVVWGRYPYHHHYVLHTRDALYVVSARLRAVPREDGASAGETFTPQVPPRELFMLLRQPGGRALATNRRIVLRLVILIRSLVWIAATAAVLAGCLWLAQLVLA